MNANPTSEKALVAPIPKGAVVGYIRGGVYFATVDEISNVLIMYATKSGVSSRLLQSALFKAIGDDKETREFYKTATVFEMALVIAWENTTLRYP